MMRKTCLLMSASLLVLTNCAAIVEGSRQDIHVRPDDTQATCIATNERGSETVMLPNPVTVKRSKTDLTVECKNPYTGAKKATTVESGLEDWWWGDIALLSILGVAIDAGTGAMWEYPHDIYVPASSAPPKPVKQ